MKKKPLTEAQRKQRAIYSSQMTSKKGGKLRSVASALHRDTGLRANR